MITHSDPTASPKKQVANAKADNAKHAPAAKATVAAIAAAKAAKTDDTKPRVINGKAVAHKVPTAPAHGATEKAPHTRRAIEQNRQATTPRAMTKEERADMANPGDDKLKATLNGKTIYVPARNAAWITPAGVYTGGATKQVAKVMQGVGKPASKPDPTPPKKTASPAKTAAPKAPAKDQKIVINAKTNPYRPTTKAYVTFEMFKTAKTVVNARAMADQAGGSGTNGKYDIGYLRYASRDGHISLV
jgi:hypothetical protein